MGNICSFLIKKKEHQIYPEVKAPNFFIDEDNSNNNTLLNEPSDNDEPPSYYEATNNITCM
jgi:hypothetical protein